MDRKTDRRTELLGHSRST